MTLTLFLPELDQAIHTKVLAAVKYYQERYSDQHFYALGLGMVEDICGFFIIGNTLEHLAEACRDEDEAYNYWYISEWKTEQFDGLPNLVHNVVAALAEKTNDDVEYDSLRQTYQAHILAVLTDMRNRGQLRNAQGDELLVWVQYADAYDEEFDDISFALLNAIELDQLFKFRYDTKKDNLTARLRQRMSDLALI
ncbi:DUF4303 domain-containing protein [Acinetobacter colistiniresistens]|uniref:DUF4303 domain-containing protein n=1 Tax=Acinetobacter colistiniresistens TaxID=280145 RepID=UPI00211B919E|nr:DUF4303 domain-containing protein [Acinetobacter colistiniresistens]UUM26959.1 DUF4303 domain-containing protein [Acinetobacter colistiniresistens]